MLQLDDIRRFVIFFFPFIFIDYDIHAHLCVILHFFVYICKDTNTSFIPQMFI